MGINVDGFVDEDTTSHISTRSQKKGRSEKGKCHRGEKRRGPERAIMGPVRGTRNSTTPPEFELLVQLKTLARFG